MNIEINTDNNLLQNRTKSTNCDGLSVSKKIDLFERYLKENSNESIHSNTIFEGYNINRKSTNKEESITTINRTSQAKQILNDILTKNGFDEKNIKLDILIDSFEEFLNKKFNCYEDQIIYTIRPNDLVYRDLSCCTLIRQFVTRNVSGELNLERIYIQVYYNSKDLIDKLYNLHFNYTSDKFDEFLANVRDENSYWEVLKLYEPVKYEITEEKLF